MHRFKSSKYKNCVAKPAKKEDSLTDIKVETPLCFGNNVAAGTKFIASNIGVADSGKVAVFTCSDSGRMLNHPLLSAHGSAVTDLEFSPFHHSMLLTASEDATVKIWQIPDGGMTDGSNLEPANTFSGFSQRPEVLRHHPIADNIVAIASGMEIQAWNIESGLSISSKSCTDLIQSVSWSPDGRSVACTTKGKSLKIVDPRSNTVTAEGGAHGNHKDSRVIWLGDTGKLATTGYTNTRARELKAWDQRNIKSCLQTMSFSSSSGVLMPFYDADTKLLFVAGKGDSSLSILEVTNGSECITQASIASLTDQTKGMAMLPKLLVDVMSCEVNRLLQLCAKQLIPIKIEVPRKSHREFASDLFPDTDSDEVVLSASQWSEGEDASRKKTSLDPFKRKPLEANSAVSSKSSSVPTTGKDAVERDTVERSVSERGDASAQSVQPIPEKNTSAASNVTHAPTKPSKPNPLAGMRQSKFRHWQATVLHPSTHITNLPKVSLTVSSACDGFHANERYLALPLAAPGGPLAILKLNEVGRLKSDLLTFSNSSAISDFAWNPFDEREVAIGLDNGAVKVWRVPEVEQSDLQPETVLEGHYAKVLSVLYHPLASDILTTVGMDMKLIIWNLQTGEMAVELSGIEEEVLHMAWSESGKYLAVVSKDRKIYVYEPRTSTEPIASGPGPEGSRGARIVWVYDDKMLLVSGFIKKGNRSVNLYDATNLESLAVEVLSSAPSILVPFYDPDSNVVFLTGKGENLTVSFEVLSESPYFFPLATFNSEQIHQGFSFLPKITCDVRKVEIARAWRLSKSSLEPISFTVPRVKMEYFQDDLYPETRDLSRPIMTAEDWLAGKNAMPGRINLKPSDMTPLSKAPKEEPKKKKYESYNPDTFKTDEQKKEELLSAMSNKLDLDKQLEQDTMEGVDEDEWDDY